MRVLVLPCLLTVGSHTAAFSPHAPSIGRGRGADGGPTPSTIGSSALTALPEAILFDCDGVLADTERDGHRPAFNRAFAESCIEEEWDPDRYGVLLEVGGGKERMTAHWDEVGWPPLDVVPGADSSGGRMAKVKELHLRKTDIFMDLINEGAIPLRPGVLRP